MTRCITQDWGAGQGRDIYGQFPRLKDLVPVSDLYETAIHNHYNDLKEGLSTTIRYVFSQMVESDRRFIEKGRLDMDAYFKNSVPRSDATSAVYVRKIAEFECSLQPGLSDKPMAYFDSDHIKAINSCSLP